MNVKRGLRTGVLLYVASFLFGLVLTGILGWSGTYSFEAPAFIWSSLVGLIVLTALFSVHYFRDPTITISPREGLQLGILFLAVGFFIDIVIIGITSIFVPGVISEIITYYLSLPFLGSIIMLILTPAVVGCVYKRKNSGSRKKIGKGTRSKKVKKKSIGRKKK
jgi:UPF0716 family protein affecting phage T7 exclusion